MKAALGILTARGGATSHAAVVARGMGRPCVVGCTGISIDEEAHTTQGRQRPAQGRRRHHHRRRNRRRVRGRCPQDRGGSWAVSSTSCSSGPTRAAACAIRTNADTPRDAKKARRASAPRVSACAAPSTCSSRPSRITAVREMILSDTDGSSREKALAKLLPVPDRGLHRPVPGDERTAGQHPSARSAATRVLAPGARSRCEELAKDHGRLGRAARAKIADLHEFNPMLGHRGVRLAV